MSFGEHGFAEMELSFFTDRERESHNHDCDTDECFKPAVYYSVKKQRYYCIKHIFIDQLEYTKFISLKPQRPSYYGKKGFKRPKKIIVEASSILQSKF